MTREEINNKVKNNKVKINELEEEIRTLEKH